MDICSPKRQRNDAMAEVDTTAGSMQVASANEKPIVRDGTYYRETGDCVILVGAVLFKIHRVLLERDMSAFSNMFSLPQENANSQTASDENPLVLYDDVDDFRALCWIMYALPTEISRQHTLQTANIQDLVSLYSISHKYHFEAHETFARDLLRKHCLSFQNKPTNRYNYFNGCPESRLRSTLRIAILTESTSRLFPSILQNIWKNRLNQMKGSISFALEVGEALGLRNFMAELYYLELTRTEPVPLEDSPAYAHLVTDLAPHQKLALYQGSWSLRYYWSKTRQMAAKKHFECIDESDYDSDGACDHVCSVVWKEAWSGVGENEWDSKPFDPLKVLHKIQIAIHNRNDDDDYTPCSVKLISDMIADLNNSLADHFFGPLPASIPDIKPSS